MSKETDVTRASLIASGVHEYQLDDAVATVEKLRGAPRIGGRFTTPFDADRAQLERERLKWFDRQVYESQNAFIAESSAAYPDVDSEEASSLTSEARSNGLEPGGA